MSPYVFVIAAILAIIPILIIFKITMERIKEDPTQVRKAQTHFFIGVALSEVIPIILVIYGLSNVVPVASVEELYMPGIITILFMGVASFFVFLQRIVDVDESIKETINTFASISLVLISSIPIMSVVGLFMMMP